MAVVEAPISTSVDTMIGLRPMRSPKCEEPPANRARGESHCEHTEDGNRAGERAQRGKEQRVESERREKSVHEKSYHSMVVPRKHDTSIRRLGALMTATPVRWISACGTAASIAM